MTMIRSLVHWLGNAGDTVLPFLYRQTLYSSVVLVAVLVLTRLFRRASPLLHMGLWSLVLLRLLLPPDFYLPFSGRGVLERLGWFDRQAASAGAFPSPDALQMLSATAAAAMEGADPAFGGSEDSGSVPWSAVLFAAWLGGVLVFGAVSARRLLKFHRITEQAKPLTDRRLLSDTKRWRKMHGIRRPVRIVSSDRCLSPFTVGLLRPVIHVPEGTAGRTDPALMESIIAHELAHVKTLDSVWMRIQNLVQIVYFFHPAVWIAVSRIHVLRECLCDEIVIAKRRLSPQSYGLGLLAVLKWNVFGAEPLGLLPEFGSSRRKIMERINHIKSPRRTGKTAAAGIVLGTVLLGLFLLPMAGGGRDVHETRKHDPEHLKAVSEPDTAVAPFDFEKAGKFIEWSMQRVNSGKGADAAFWMNGTLPEGSPVKSMGNGKVFRVGKTEAGDLCVSVRYDGYDIRYGNLEKAEVQQGDAVEKGDSIGRINATGRVSLEIMTLKEVKEEKEEKEAKETSGFASPLPGKPVTAGFGPMRDPFTGKEMDHSGVDIKASKGSAVHAVADGKTLKAVTEYQKDQGRGRFVLLAHADGMSSMYSHLDSVLVSEGREVKRGEVIGTVGSTGRSTGPHLHLEIRKGKVAIDPASVIDFGKGELREGKEKTK